MATRRMNVRKWENPDTGAAAESFEDWTFRKVSDSSSESVAKGIEKLAGVSSEGFLWMKFMETYPPNGDGWVEVS